MRRFRGRVTPALVISVIALFLSMSCTAIAAVLVSSNSQIASNTVAGHQSIRGVHSNLIAGSINSTDLASSYKAGLKVHCPTGLLGAGALCVEPNLRPSNTWSNALKTCALAGRHLPDQGELALAFDGLGAPQAYEWTSNAVYTGTTTLAFLLAESANRSLLAGTAENVTNVTNANNYRCVSAPLN